MNVVVLAGGLSTERDVSISTGAMVCNSLKNKGHKAILIDVYLGYNASNNDIEHIFDIDNEQLGEVSSIGESAPDISKVKAMRQGDDNGFIGKNVIKICKMADIVFMALHGENGENGKLQAAFDLSGIKYTGTGYLGSALAMNKWLAKQLLQANNILTPDGIILKSSDNGIDAIIEEFKLPCVVKPCSGGSSIGVSIAYDLEQLGESVKTALKYDPEILIEEYVKGREFSVGILGEKSLPVIEIIPKQGFYDYVNKYQKGLTEEICPADLDDSVAKKMQEIALEVHNVLKLETYSRIDFILNDKNSIYCLEANTLPGMTPTSLLPQEALAIGISHADLCDLIIKEALSRYE